MNKRLIQKFLDKSCYDETDQEALEDWCNVEKFAELIVRECADICHKLAEDSNSYVVHDGDTCAEQIKKHFGVIE